MTVAAMAMVTEALVMARTMVTAVMRTLVTTRRGAVKFVAVILPSCLLLIFGRAFGTNPTVGIGPWQMPASRACGLIRMRGAAPHIPPTPSVGVGGGGLMKGTPRNIRLFVVGVLAG
jgi:hypothetical protein